jgi:hypothetical protein
MNRLNLTLRHASIAGAALALLQGCAMSCDNYRTYDDTLDSWIGYNLEDYERRSGNRASNVMERPQGRLEYTYSTPYVSYDGSQTYCRTYLEADRETGKIIAWRYDGDCYMHGYCAG